MDLALSSHHPKGLKEVRSARDPSFKSVPCAAGLGQRSEDQGPRGARTKDQGPRNEDHQRPRTEDQRLRTKDRDPRTENRGPRTEGAAGITS